MASISALIDFLMSLMSDEDTKRAFAGNPDQTLADKGLRDVSAQDVKDARLIMADQGACRPRPDGGGSSPSGYHDGGLTAGGGNTAVREILHTTNTFEIDQSKHIAQNIFNIDNHRTTIVDSFNSHDKVIAIQDNDTTNNTDVDVDTGDEDDRDDKADDKTDDNTDDNTEDGTEDGPADGTDTPDGTDVPDGSDLPEPPLSEPPLSEEQPDEGPADGPFPTEPEPQSEEPVDEDPGLDPGDGADPFPPEPEPTPEPIAEVDDLPVA